MRRRPAAGSGRSSSVPSDGGKTWETPGGGPTTSPQGLPKGESNKFVYEGEVGKHLWYDGTPHPWEFKRVWHLEPSLDRSRTLFMPEWKTPRCSRSTNGGATWQELAGLAQPRKAISGSLAPAEWACTRSFSIKTNPNRIYVAISAAGVFRTDDGGKTWKPITKGLKSAYELPDKTFEVGHCVHRIAMHPSRPNVLFMQKHWDVNRSDDARRELARGQRQSAERFRVSRSTFTRTSRTPSTSSRSRATRSIIRPTESCASIAAGPAATNGNRSRKACRNRTVT